MKYRNGILAAMLCLGLVPQAFAEVTVAKGDFTSDWIYLDVARSQKGSYEHIVLQSPREDLQLALAYVDYRTFRRYIAEGIEYFQHPGAGNSADIGYLEGACANWKFEGMSEAYVADYLAIATGLGQMQHDRHPSAGERERLVPDRCYVMGAIRDMTNERIYMFEVTRLANDDGSITLRQVRVLEPQSEQQ